jgi:dTDP-4-dehydrorhamnose 3,5-epimerase
MEVIESRLSGVLLIEPVIFHDHRGFFMESYNANKLFDLGINCTFVQDNHSLSIEAGTIRGMHFQAPPKSQAKFVRVIAGAIFDVVVDLRKDSPTFGQWEGFTISSDNKRQLWVPQGFAHGFCTLVPHTQVLYKVDNYYSPEHEKGIIWNDPCLSISWPTDSPVISEKDKAHPAFSEAISSFYG